ncbi:hypothetical protein AMTRI_Chr03g44410 [Amborella trichopoda]
MYTMKQVHAKKRNRLEKKRLNDLVFVQYNQRLKECHQDQLQIEDPILAKDLDPTSEYLTWTQVKESAGLASIPMRATRSQTQRKGKDMAQEKGKKRGRGRGRSIGIY